MRNPFKQYGDLEYRYKAQEGFAELDRENWKSAKKIFKDLLWDRPSESAYIGAILCHMKIRALHPDAVFVPTFDMLNVKPFEPNKIVWPCSNMKELEADCCIPYFNNEDLKSIFSIDENIYLINEWYLYLLRELKSFITRWHECKYIYDIQLSISKECLQEIKDFYYGVINKYQDMIALAEGIINNHFARKINEQYQAAFLKAYPGSEIPKKTVTVKRTPPNSYTVVPYEPIKAVLKSKHNKKAKIAAFSITCGYVLLSLLLSLLHVGFSAQIITILGMLLPAIYTFVKKLLFGTKHPSWVGHLKLFSLGVLAVAVITPIFNLSFWSMEEFFATFSAHIPLLTYLFVAGKLSRKNLIIMMIAMLILTFIAGFGFVGSLLVHVVGIAAAIAVQPSKPAVGITFVASIISSICASLMFVGRNGDWGYFVLTLLALEFTYEILWRAALVDLFDWAVPFPLFVAIGKILGVSGAAGGSGSSSGYNNGSGYSNDSEEESSSSGGYDWAEMDRYRQQEAAAFAQAEEERRREANEAYAQSYGFDSAQDAQDHGFM